MPNIVAIISRHNKKLLSNRVVSGCITPSCNCRNKTSCRLKGKCRESYTIYKTTIKSGDVAKHYCSCCETEFKTRFDNHNQSMKFRRKCNAIELSKLSGSLKTQDKTPVLNGVSRPAPPLTTQELNGAISHHSPSVFKILF